MERFSAVIARQIECRQATTKLDLPVPNSHDGSPALGAQLQIAPPERKIGDLKSGKADIGAALPKVECPASIPIANHRHAKVTHKTTRQIAICLRKARKAHIPTRALHNFHFRQSKTGIAFVEILHPHVERKSPVCALLHPTGKLRQIAPIGHEIARKLRAKRSAAVILYLAEGESAFACAISQPRLWDYRRQNIAGLFSNKAR